METQEPTKPLFRDLDPAIMVALMEYWDTPSPHGNITLCDTFSGEEGYWTTKHAFQAGWEAARRHYGT